MTSAAFELLYSIGWLLQMLAVLLPLLLWWNPYEIREKLLTTPANEIPGFGSDDFWKMAVVTFLPLFITGSIFMGVAGVIGSPEEIQVDGGSISQQEVLAGDAVDVSVEVSNPSAKEQSREITLLVEGTTVETREVSLASFSSESIQFEHVFEEEGQYEVKVGSTVVGTVSVQSSTDGGGTTTTTSEETAQSTTTVQTTTTEESVLPFSPPENIPEYSIDRVRDVSYGDTERRAIDVTVEGELVDYSRQELLKVSKDIVANYVKQDDVNAIALHFWRDSNSMGTAYATVMWAPDGEWGQANSVQTGSYSTHEFAIEGEPYFEFENIQAPDDVTVGEEFSISMTVRNGGIEEGEAGGWFEDIDDNTYANFDVELVPGEQKTVTKTVTIEEYPTLGEKTLYFTSFARVIHNSSSISLNVTRAG